MTDLEQHRLPRRRFLSGMAGGAAALALSGLPGATALAAEDRWKMKLSCSSISYSKLSIEEACQRIAKLGFEAIDIWSPHAGCPHLDDVQTRLGPNGLKELLEKNKLKLYSFSVYQGGYPKYAELLGKSGGGVAVRGSSGPCKPDELKAKMKQFIESLKPELELAEKYDSYLAIENHGHALLNTHDSFKAFVEANDNPRLGIALAPYHIQAAGESVEDQPQAHIALSFPDREHGLEEIALHDHQLVCPGLQPQRLFQVQRSPLKRLFPLQFHQRPGEGDDITLQRQGAKLASCRVVAIASQQGGMAQPLG